MARTLAPPARGSQSQQVSPDVSAPTIDESSRPPWGRPGLPALSPATTTIYEESATIMSGGNKRAAPSAVSCMAATIIAVVILLVVASALLFLLSPPASAPPPREPVELAIGFAGHERWLDALRAWAKLACFKFRTVEPRYDVLRSPASVKEAAKETLEMGKETVKHSAESAARATEEALERTTDKVKRKVSLSARRCGGDL
nr:unnamed protein product [Digitaria exilis]